MLSTCLSVYECVSVRAQAFFGLSSTFVVNVDVNRRFTHRLNPLVCRIRYTLRKVFKITIA